MRVRPDVAHQIGLGGEPSRYLVRLLRSRVGTNQTPYLRADVPGVERSTPKQRHVLVGQLPYDLANDTEILPSVKTALADLEATAARASDLADSLATSVADPTTPVGVLLKDSESGSDLKTMLANLERSTVLLNEDLIAIRSNFLFRPYFRKKEREEKREARRKAREAKQ